MMPVLLSLVFFFLSRRTPSKPWQFPSQSSCQFLHTHPAYLAGNEQSLLDLLDIKVEVGPSLLAASSQWAEVIALEQRQVGEEEAGG